MSQCSLNISPLCFEKAARSHYGRLVRLDLEMSTNAILHITFERSRIFLLGLCNDPSSSIVSQPGILQGSQDYSFEKSLLEVAFDVVPMDLIA